MALGTISNETKCVLNGLIDFLPYGAWQPITHVSFQSFQMN